MDNTNAIGDYVFHRLPTFIQEDYAVFANFLREYYNWLSVDYEHTSKLFSLLQDKNIFTISEHEADNLLRDFGLYEIFGAVSFSRKKNLLMSVHQLYQSKGTANFIETVFKFFDIPVYVYNPRDRLLTLSNTRYIKNISYIEVDADVFDLYKSGLMSLVFSTDPNIMHPVYMITAISENRIKIVFEKQTDTIDTNALSVSVHYDSGDIVTVTPRYIKTLATFQTINKIDINAVVNIGDDIVDESGNIIGYVTDIVTSKIADIGVTNGGSDYKTGDQIIDTDNKLVGFITSVDDAGAVTGTRVLNPDKTYTKSSSVSVVSKNGTGAVVELTWDTSDDPGTPIGGFTALDLTDSYTGALFIKQVDYYEVTPSLSLIVDTPNFYAGTVLNALDSNVGAYLQDSSKWHHFSRAIGMTPESYSNVPDNLVGHIAQVGTNVFIDLPDSETMSLATVVGFNRMLCNDTVLESSTLMRTIVGFDSFKILNPNLLLPLRQRFFTDVSFGHAKLDSQTMIVYKIMNTDVAFNTFGVNNTINLLLPNRAALDVVIGYNSHIIEPLDLV